MIRRIPALAVLLAVAGCGAERTEPAEAPEGAGAAPETASAPAAPSTEGPPSSGRSGASGTSAGEMPTAEPVMAQIFDETPEPGPPRRVTLHVLVPRDATRDQLRRTLSDLLLERAASDEALVAARAIGYTGVRTGENEAQMVPFVWAEWLPPDGWYESQAVSRNAIHRVYFYHEVAPEW